MHADMRERGFEKFLQQLLELGFATRFNPPRNRNVNGFVHRRWSKKKTQGCGDIIHIAATGLVNIASSKKMNVGCAKRDVPLDLPLQIYIECRGDVG